MDCSWGHGANKACDGGDQDEALQYVVEAGGIAPEASYTYMGADGFCRDRNTSQDQLVKFKVRLHQLGVQQSGLCCCMTRRRVIFRPLHAQRSLSCMTTLSSGGRVDIQRESKDGV